MRALKKYMKLLFAALVCALPIVANASANKYLEYLRGWVNAGCSMDFEFKAADRSGREVLSYNGTLVIKDKSYALAVPDAMKVICNGKEKIMINEETKEAMLAGNDAQSRDLLENPLQLVFDYDSAYNISNGRNDSVVLRDKSKHSAYPEISIWFKSGSQAGSWVPQRFEIQGKDGSIYTVIIKSFSSPSKADAGEFELSPGKLSGYKLIDLR